MIKLIILDDEVLIRESILEIVNWEELGIQVCGLGENGLEGVELIKEHNPDIVLTDIMMPGMNGLELVEWIKSYNPSIRSIILTGYQDFEFARTAIKLDVSDFILKPTKLDDLEKALSKNVQIIKGNREKRHRQKIIKDQLERLKPIAHHNYITNLIFNPYINYDAIKKELAYYQIDIRNFAIVLIEIDKVEGEKDLVNNRFDHYALLKYEIDQYLTEYNIIFTSLINPQNFNDLILLISHEEIPDNKNYMSNLWTQFKARLTDFPFTISIGYSRYGTHLKQIRDCYQQAKLALDHTFFLGQDMILSYEDCQLEQKDNFQLFTLPRELFNAIESCDREKCLYHLKDVIDNIRQLPTKKQLTNSYIHIHLELQQLLKATVKDYRQEDIMDILKEVANFTTNEKAIESVRRNILGTLESIEEQRNMMYSQVVTKILHYIEEHAYERLTLNQIAHHFYFSPEHVSRLLRKETGKTFTELLHEQQIQRAKELLVDTDMKITDVATEIGFGDYRYFGKLFKKYTNTTPRIYRNRGELK